MKKIVLAIILVLAMTSVASAGRVKTELINHRSTGAIYTQCLDGFLFAVAEKRLSDGGIAIVQVYAERLINGQYLSLPAKCTDAK